MPSQEVKLIMNLIGYQLGRLLHRRIYCIYLSSMNYSDNDSDCVDFKPYQAKLSLQNYLFPLLFFVIFILGLIGNVTVIYIIFSKPGMRTVPNLLLVNLSLGDVVLLFGYMTFYIPSYIFSSFYGGAITCGLWTFLKMNTLGVSIFTLTFMAVDRFRAITKPMHSQVLSRYALISVMTGIWVVASVLALPVTISSEIHNFPIEENNTCWIMSICSSKVSFTVINQYDIIVWIKFIVYFATPFLVISFCYVAISLTLCSKENASTPLVGNEPKTGLLVPRRQMEARRKLAVVVLVLVVIFVICRLPNESHAIFVEHQGMSIHWWQSTGNILSYLYSCVNPIILCVLSPLFRKFMFKIWFPCITANRESDNYQSMPLNHSNFNINTGHSQALNCNLNVRDSHQKPWIVNSPQRKQF